MLFSLIRSSIVMKLLMAITGLAWIGFVIGHLLGNLTLFLGGSIFNQYAHHLESLGPLLYIAEGGLVILLSIHIISAIQVTLTNWRSRGMAYQMNQDAGGTSYKSLSSKTMIYTGIVLIGFIVIHVWMFKYGAYYKTVIHGKEMRDLHRLVVESFSNPWIVLGYVAAMVFLGFHLRHAFWSAFQSLGIHHPRYTPLIYGAGVFLAIGLALGFIVIPLWIYLTGGIV